MGSLKEETGEIFEKTAVYRINISYQQEYWENKPGMRVFSRNQQRTIILLIK